MKTSYFENIRNIQSPLSISGKAPAWYTGPQFKTLAPKYEFFSKYKEGLIDSVGYTNEFYRLVLKPLNPQEIYNTIINNYGEEVTLLCYERRGEFCHRRIVSKWFEDEIGIIVPEVSLV